MRGPETVGSQAYDRDMEKARICAKCGSHPAGAGGVLCPACLALIMEQSRDYWQPSARIAGTAHTDGSPHVPFDPNGPMPSVGEERSGDSTT